MEIKKAVLKYELEDDLPLSYGHKLRGYFANKFEHILFHHHKKSGELLYQYPLIQYKIIGNKPTVIALGKGCNIVSRNFLDIENLVLGKKVYKNPTVKLNVSVENIYVSNKEKYKYRFLSPWFALNKKNYNKYLDYRNNYSKNEVDKFLSNLLIGNILSFAKGINYWIEKEIAVVLNLKEINFKYKNQKMIGFIGSFKCNVNLPDHIGLGKSTSRGFGTIKRSK